MASESSPAALETELVEVYRAHAAELQRYAASLARSTEEARDAVQETFLRYFVERRCNRAIEHPRAWLHQVLRNHVLGRLKTAPSRWEVAGENLDEVADLQETAETRMVRSQSAQALAGTLTQQEWNCVYLRAEGLSYAEIAAALDVRSGTVSALLSRVHKKLRQPVAETIDPDWEPALRPLS